MPSPRWEPLQRGARGVHARCFTNVLFVRAFIIASFTGRACEHGFEYSGRFGGGGMSKTLDVLQEQKAQKIRGQDCPWTLPSDFVQRVGRVPQSLRMS